MRVLLSAYACMPNSGTEPGNGWNWAMHLAERGMQVHVLTVVEGREGIEAYRQLYPTPKITFSYITIPTRRYRHCSGMHYAMWQWSALKVARALHKAEPFEVIHHVTYGSIHVPTQLWRLGVPVVFGPVGGGQITPKSMLGFLGAHKGTEKLRSLFTRVIARSPVHRSWISKMSVVLVTNRDTLELVRKMGRTDVQLQFDTALPLTVMAGKPRVFVERDGPVRLLWVGTMLPRKALPLTLDAFARVKHPATLTIIGDGIEPSVLRGMIAERGLTDRVEWAGRRLPWMDVQQAYLEHDALIFTSLRDSCAAQLLESMAQGLPVITLDLHGARDLVPEAAGIKVPVVTPEQVIADVAAAVDRFARMPAEEKSRMSHAGWTFARELSWTMRAKQAERLYRGLVSAAAPQKVVTRETEREATLTPG